MVEKPTSGDSEQRRDQTRAAREQSGLPAEEKPGTKPLTEVNEQADESKEQGTRDRR